MHRMNQAQTTRKTNERDAAIQMGNGLVLEEEGMTGAEWCILACCAAFWLYVFAVLPLTTAGGVLAFALLATGAVARQEGV